jgi:hypothetical protein
VASKYSPPGRPDFDGIRKYISNLLKEFRNGNKEDLFVPGKTHNGTSFLERTIPPLFLISACG